jgi:hypothetical protein
LLRQIWDNIFPDLLDKVIQFGYDKNEFLSDCGFCVGGKRFNKQMIKNGLRWYKLLDSDESDIEYFTLDPDDRPELDDSTYNDYVVVKTLI